MASFQKGPNYNDPFGADFFLRSTQDVKTESYTIDHTTVPVTVVDGTDQKYVRKGDFLAVLTGGANVGKVAIFQTGAADGAGDAANIVGVCQTFLPWQSLERDVEIACVYEASVIEANVYQYDAGGVRVPVLPATIAALPTKKLKLLFH